MQIWSWRKGHITTKKLENRSILYSSSQLLLESKSQHFRDTAIRENSTHNLTNRWKRTRSNKWRSYIQEDKEVKEKLHPISFNYVWTTFGHKVQYIYASQRSQILQSRCKREAHFRQQQGQQKARVLTGCIIIKQNTQITVNRVEQQELTSKKLRKWMIWFSEVINELIHHYLQESQMGRGKNIGSKVALLCYSSFNVLENLMAKRYRHIWRTDQITPQINYRKDLMSSKDKHVWEIRASLNPWR